MVNVAPSQGYLVFTVVVHGYIKFELRMCAAGVLKDMSVSIIVLVLMKLHELTANRGLD